MFKLFLLITILAGCATLAQRILAPEQTPLHILQQWRNTQPAITHSQQKLIIDDTPEPSHTKSVTLEYAFQHNLSKVEVESFGRIIKVLSDEEHSGDEQRFMVQTDSLTLLVIHNTRHSKQKPTLHEGDIVFFKGEYEWGLKGGRVSRTHADKNSHNEDGWLTHNGTIYQ